MGIFNKQKNQKVIKEYRALSKDGLSTIFMSDINTSTIVQYKNDEKTRIIRAKIKKYKTKKGERSVKNADYIAFELLEDEELTPEIIKEAMAEYEDEKAIDSEQRIYYIGRCIQSRQYGYYFSYMCNEVEYIVTKMIEEEEQASRQRKGIIPIGAIQSKESKYRASLDARKNMQPTNKQLNNQRTIPQIQTGIER